MSLDLSLYGEADTGAEHKVRAYVFDRNITHNVGGMWRLAGRWDAVYSSNGKRAEEVTAMVAAGVAEMKAHPGAFRALNPANGWGSYEDALDFARAFLAACREHPKALIGVSA